FEDPKLDNTQETLINNNLENLNSEETSDIIDISINESVDKLTFTLEDNQQRGKTFSSEYGTKTSTSSLKEHLIKEHKHN
ncbi:8671_t:CDS:2, partial [Diversispora eburnea]